MSITPDPQIRATINMLFCAAAALYAAPAWTTANRLLYKAAVKDSLSLAASMEQVPPAKLHHAWKDAIHRRWSPEQASEACWRLGMQLLVTTAVKSQQPKPQITIDVKPIASFGDLLDRTLQQQGIMPVYA